MPYEKQADNTLIPVDDNGAYTTAAACISSKGYYAGLSVIGGSIKIPILCEIGKYCENLPNSSDGSGRCSAGFYCPLGSSSEHGEPVVADSEGCNIGEECKCAVGYFCPTGSTASTGKALANALDATCRRNNDCPCPTGYDDNPNPGKASVRDCKIQCAVGTQVVNPITYASYAVSGGDTSCTTPSANNWYVNDTHCVSVFETSVTSTCTSMDIPRVVGAVTDYVKECVNSEYHAVDITNPNDSTLVSTSDPQYHDQQSDCRKWCTAGTYIAATGATTCTTCETGKFKTDNQWVSETATSSCKECNTEIAANYNANTSTDILEHDEKEDCQISCAPGTRITSQGGQCVTPTGDWYVNTNVVNWAKPNTSSVNPVRDYNNQTTTLNAAPVDTGTEKAADTINMCIANFAIIDGAGVATSHDGYDDCVLACDPGYYLPDDVPGTDCTIAPIGYYSEGFAPVPQTGANKGHKMDKIACDAGYYCPEIGTINGMGYTVGDETPKYCAINYYCSPSSTTNHGTPVENENIFAAECATSPRKCCGATGICTCSIGYYCPVGSTTSLGQPVIETSAWCGIGQVCGCPSSTISDAEMSGEISDCYILATGNVSGIDAPLFTDNNSGATGLTFQQIIGGISALPEYSSADRCYYNPQK